MTDMHSELRELKQFGSEQIEVIFRKLKPPEESAGKYPPLTPGVSIEDGIRIERDVSVTLRDGTIIYTDIYRPDGAINIPAIVAWSPYGKRAGYVAQKPLHGVPAGAVSPMAKFEGPDPAYWCHYGYAVINPDSRGAGNSEGDILFAGTAEGRDCYDLIEWVAVRDWSNGRVGMSGNSWLARAQWFTAAEQPPHLAAIAPWEGLSDYYRDIVCPGGIPEVGFVGKIQIPNLFGRGHVEDMTAMIRKYPLMNGYWEDKIACFEKIKIPAYIVNNWKHFHSQGTLAAFRRISSPDKWLRVHNTFEWPDYYSPENLEDLRRFFDRYLKGIHNGWEYTLRVRLSVLDPGGEDRINRPENEWPLARTQYEKLFLDAGASTLTPKPVKKEAAVRYDAEKGQAVFTVRFDEDTELTGYMKLRLWVEAEGADDIDLFVAVQKLDRQGNLLPSLVFGLPNAGAKGWLRVSHRQLDESRSTPSEPYLTHRREQLLHPGEIVPVEIGIWPTSMLWHAGQQLRVVVQGYAFWWLEDKLFPGGPVFSYELRNRGYHIIHAGGKFDSHLLIPKIPG